MKKIIIASVLALYLLTSSACYALTLNMNSSTPAPEYVTVLISGRRPGPIPLILTGKLDTDGTTPIKSVVGINIPAGVSTVNISVWDQRRNLTVSGTFDSSKRVYILWNGTRWTLTAN